MSFISSSHSSSFAVYYNEFASSSISHMLAGLKPYRSSQLELRMRIFTTRLLLNQLSATKTTEEN